MTDLNLVLESKNLVLMLWTAGILGVIHTLAGPDHYVPFVMMARAEKWALRRTLWITFLCGLGHVGSSIVIGLSLGWAGTAVAQWEGSSWLRLHEWRGDLSAWLLMGLGAAFMVHGLVQTARGRAHSHEHVHPVGVHHDHIHAHEEDHLHVHPAGGGKARWTPWVLFVVFVFGPCESLIPLMLAATAVAGIPGSLLVAVVFSLLTVATILGTVSVLFLGFRKLSLGFLERHATSLAGISLILCGAAIRFLGL